ncbi:MULTISPECIES: hypothetical protein [Rhodococcus erythropolis group]|nr:MULTISPECIES: hypothetical protein [Rhodococcus erythropolis group]MDJ0489669.1 hypothetical protein [Rhodococcus qingshengii]OFV73773.1 hypothetical protein RERY_56240 [Rhodococcus erythropolis]
MPCEPQVRVAAATSGGGTTFRSSRRSGARQRCASIALPRVL